MGELLLSQDSQSVVFLQDPKGYFIFDFREPIVINCDCGFGFSAHSHIQFQIWVCFEAWKHASANRKPKLLKPWKSYMGIACFEEMLVIESLTVHGSSGVCTCHFTALSPLVLTVFLPSSTAGLGIFNLHLPFSSVWGKQCKTMTCCMHLKVSALH